MSAGVKSLLRYDKWKRRRQLRSPPQSPSPAWSLGDNEGTVKPTIKLQRKSLLFTKLSAELRLMIYEAVLGDSLHLTHICNVYDRCNHTYPIRGIDKASAYAEAKKGGSKFLSLLLSCHAIYSEALPVLFNSPHFHFACWNHLVRFGQSIPRPQWLAIRHLHLTPYFPLSEEIQLPGPASHDPSPNPRKWVYLHSEDWKYCTRILSELPHLLSLRLDLEIALPTDTWRFRNMRSRVDPEDLLFVSLVELRDSGTKAKKFVVEANLDLPAELREELGEVGFEIRGPRDKKRIEYSGTTGCSYDGALGFVMMD